jgi:hypothetical protein
MYVATENGELDHGTDIISIVHVLARWDRPLWLYIEYIL